MEEAAAVRNAAQEAVRDVVPADLQQVIERFIAGGSVAPGVLALRAARETDTAAASAVEGLADRAAGVQLIYDGLRLTRELAHEEPWTAGRGDEGDVEILAADVLVARGFYLLARTDAAEAAVEVVRAFGRDQTERRSAEDPTAIDHNLERDVLELAVVTGVTSAGGEPPADAAALATALVADLDGGFPDAGDFFTAAVDDALDDIGDGPAGVRTSAE